MHTCQHAQLPLGVSEQLGGLVSETLCPLLSIHDSFGLGPNALLDLMVLICQLPIQDLSMETQHTPLQSVLPHFNPRGAQVCSGAHAYLLGFIGLVSCHGCRFFSPRCCHAVVGTFGLQGIDLSPQCFKMDYGNIQILLTVCGLRLNLSNRNSGQDFGMILTFAD